MTNTAANVKLKWAQFFAEQGFRIFLLPPNSKIPEAGSEWKKDATRDPAIIRQWFEDQPDANYLVAPDEDHFIVDLDVKGGRDGITDLRVLQDIYGDLPDTLVAKTPSGGLHIYWKGSAPLSVGKASLGRGIDIRGNYNGRAGYVVGPGSSIDGSPYEIVDDDPIADAPSWLTDVCQQSAGPPLKRPEGVEIDNAIDVPRLHRYLAGLVQDGDVAVSGCGGNNRTYKLFAHLIDYLSPEKALEMVEEIWNPACVPSWEHEELETICNHAVAHRQNEIGAKASKPISEIFRLPADWMKQYADEDDPLSSGYDPGERPVVQIVESELPRVIDEAEDVLIANEVPIYQCGNMLVRPGLTTFKIADGQEATNVRLIQISKPSMVETFTKAVEFQRYDKRSNDWVRKDCPPAVAETYLAREGQWRLRKLTGIIHTPTLRPDGSLLGQPGYDVASGLLYEPCGVTFPVISQAPNKEDAAAALRLFKDLLATFPFTSPASLSVSLSGLLTTLVRRSLTTAPLHGMNAPTAGSGKSLQVDMAALLGTGKAAPVIAQGNDEAETSKRLGAELMSGSSIISLDNCTAPVEGTLLCQMLTQQYVRPRILGQSKNLEVLSNAMVFATGNNLTFAGDMTRRAIMSTIDPGVERPELRSFAHDPRDVILRDRPRYVAAGLTVLRAYVSAGRPAMAQPLGSFEDWSGLVRNALLWLGEADPCATMEDLRESDPEREKLGRLLYNWDQVIGDKAVTANQVLTASHGDATGARNGLYEALQGVAPPGLSRAISNINARMLGEYLAKHQKRLVDGRQVVKSGTYQGTVSWQIVHGVHP